MDAPPDFVVPARSRANIIGEAALLRKVLQLDSLAPVPIAEILEFSLYDLVDGYNFRVRTYEELGRCEGLTLLDANQIHLREDVYDALQRGENRARFTAAHELGHLMLGHNQGFARKKTFNVPAYEDGEWQANTFAGTFLISPELAAHAGNPAFTAVLACTSTAAAENTFRHYLKEGMLK